MTYPQGLLPHDLLKRSEEFYQAYMDLPPGSPPAWPRYFMLCQSIELALKAYLAFHGASEGELMKQNMRHNLENLLTEAVGKGLLIGPLARGEIEQLNEAHSKHWPRYPKNDGKPVFTIDQFEPYVIELIRHVARSLRGENYKLYVDY
jgi:hypothetical protein